MENKYNESDLKKAYLEGMNDKASFLVVIIAGLITTSVVGSILGRLVPPVLEAIFKPTVSVEEGNQKTIINKISPRYLP